MVICGIDGGLSGGISLLAPGFQPETFPLPITKFNNKKTYDLLRLREYLVTSKPDVVILESAQAYPNQGSVSTFRTGECYGQITGLVIGLGIELLYIHPKKWQAAMLPKNEDTKLASIKTAKLLFPDTSLRRTPRCTTDCDGLSDSLLIAEYGRILLDEAEPKNQGNA